MTILSYFIFLILLFSSHVRKIAQKEFQQLLAERLFTSLKTRHHGHHRHHPAEEAKPSLARWTLDQLETKKRELDFRGITVLDLGKTFFYLFSGGSVFK